MHLIFDLPALSLFLLVLARLSGLLLFSPALGLQFVPVAVRIGVLVALSLLLAGTLPANLPPPPTSAAGLGIAASYEFLLGSMLGYGIRTAFAALSAAGHLLEIQMGFGSAALFDPNTQVESPLMSVLFTMLGGALFFSMDVHHALLRSFADSFVLLPAGQSGLFENTDLLVRQFGMVFSYALAIAAPVFVGLIVLDSGMAILSRTMPQLNIYFVVLPLKIFVGLLLLALCIEHAGFVIRNLMAQSLIQPLDLVRSTN